MNEVTISILTYTQLERAKTCIAAIQAGGEDVNFVLTANGSPEAAAYFTKLSQEFPNIQVVVNEKNEGFWKPNNHALTLCETKFFCLCNDDLIVPHGWLTALKRPFLGDPLSVFSTSKSGCSALLPTFHGTGGREEYCEGSLLLIDTAIAKKHGLFEPLPGMAYGEDSHASLRFRELGYHLHWVTLSVSHVRAATSRTVPEARAWQEANHAYLKKRWAHYLSVRCFGYPIIVKRAAANGDVLLTTPIIRALHERHPLSPIYVETQTPQIYANHPYVRKTDRKIPMMSTAQLINLDNAYEVQPDRHIVDSYAARAGLENVSHRTEIYLSPADEARAEKLISAGDWIAVHAGPAIWKSKQWPFDRFQEVIKRLRATGNKVVLVGSGGPNLPNDSDQRGQTTVQQMAAIIKRCRLFIGLDSLPLHCAEAVGTPTVPLFGVTDPKFILTRPEQSTPVCGTTPSFGLRHRIKNSGFVDDGGAAMNSITVEMVTTAVNSRLLPEKPIETLPMSFSQRYFLGSSYFDKRQANRPEFFTLWKANTARRFPNASRVVIIAEAGSQPPEPIPANYDVVHLSGDLGHVTMLESGEKKHAFGGWTAHMVALAMMAYCDEADFIYKESDCIAWGNVVEKMYQDIGDGDIVFGGPQKTGFGMPSAQSLFLVRHRFIPEFVAMYLSFGGDAKVYGETKMCMVEDKIGKQRSRRLSFPGDRDRPIAYEDPVGYAQQMSAEEIAELQKRNLI